MEKLNIDELFAVSRCASETIRAQYLTHSYFSLPKSFSRLNRCAICLLWIYMILDLLWYVRDQVLLDSYPNQLSNTGLHCNPIQQVMQAAVAPRHLYPSYHNDDEETAQHTGMSTGEATPSTSSQVCQDAHPTHEETTGDDNPSDTSPQSTSILDELRRDDASVITYSYASTWSSNQTMSNLVGPGRLLGKLYSWAGSSLERRLRKVALRAGIGSYARAVIMLERETKEKSSGSLTLWSMNERVVEKLCEALLVCTQYFCCLFFVFSLSVTNKDITVRKIE